MERYLYLTATPEALIASMLPPVDFGNYLSVGTNKRTRGQAIFFEIDQEAVKDIISWDFVERECVPHSDGSPKNTKYLSVYRVLEQIPLSAFKNVYLTTDDGRVLEIEKAPYPGAPSNDGMHLYQELCPVTPRIASMLSPQEFIQFVTNKTSNVFLPKIIFVDLQLGELATDPLKGNVGNLPYSNMDHLRDCLQGLKGGKDKRSKTVIRFFQGELLYRLFKSGVFVGAPGDFLYYPFPSIDKLESEYYAWWRSAMYTAMR